MDRGVRFLGRQRVMAMLWLWLFLPFVARAAEGNSPEFITTASHARALAQLPVKRIVQLRLEGVVYGVDHVHRALALRDDSGFVWLEGVSFEPALAAGARVVVEGAAALGHQKVLLEAAPLVEQDWYHGVREATGIIHLKAGRHAFELRYFQGATTKSLDVSYEGPGISRRSLPASALFCADPSAPDRIIPGVQFETFEGKWNQLPDLTSARRVASGVASDLSIEISGLETNFALRFSGLIEIPTEGNYQFTVASDDGARFALNYDASHQVRVTGEADLLEPVPVIPGQQWESPDSVWAEAEGTVKQIGRQAGKLQMELNSDHGGWMRVVVSDGAEVVTGMLLNSRIRARGLCRSTIDLSGGWSAGKLFVPGMDEITIVEATQDQWLKHLPSAISNLTTALTLQTPHSIVRLDGTITAVNPGRFFVLYDGVGRIRVRTSQVTRDELGTRVEVMGRVVVENGEPELVAATYRTATASAPDQSLPTLTSIEQVRRLRPEQVPLKYPVKLRGVVTFLFRGGMRAHVQGEREGIYVSGLSTSQQSLRLGELYEFEGYTSPGAFSPVMTYRTAIHLGSGQIPSPLRPTREQLMNGSLDAQWVEVRGVVLDAEDDLDLILRTREGNVTARVFETDVPTLVRYVGAIVRVRGTVRPFANQQRQLRSVVVQVPSTLFITVDEPAPANPFAAQAKQVPELMQFDANAASIQRVTVAGQLLHLHNGTGFVTDGTNGMRFYLREGAQAELAAGDRIEVVGFPRLRGLSPLIEDALVRRVESAPLPNARLLGPEQLLARENDANRVQVEGVLLTVSTNQADQVLEVQTGSRIYLARLAHERGALPAVARGSRVQLTGTFAGEGASDSLIANVQSFELLLNSPADIVVLEQPSWWTLGRALMLVGGLLFVLAMALVWIHLLRRQVESRTRELKEEIEERKRMELEVERIHQELVDASRQAGQAEVASSVLHNVGNVLNSVNISGNVIAEKLRNLRVGNVSKAASLIHDHTADLGRFLTEDQNGRQLPAYLGSLGRQLTHDREQLLGEVKELTENIEHINEIVAMQQSYARVAGVTETMAVAELVENAVKMHAGAFQRHGVKLERQFDNVPPVTVDRHKVLQILVNLLRNAEHACDETGRQDKRVAIRISRATGDRVRIEISDNGIGIPRENLVKIFGHGFTTRRNGHGFGLHSAALAARELRGTLTVHSEGPGTGATFALELPLGNPAVQSEPLPCPTALGD